MKTKTKKTELDVDNDYALKYINRQIVRNARKGNIYAQINVKTELPLSIQQIEFVIDKLVATGYDVYMRDKNNQQPMSISYAEQLLIGW